MRNPQSGRIGFEWIVIVLLLAVQVGGFWMTENAIEHRTITLQQQGEVLRNDLVQLLKEVGNMHKDVMALEGKVDRAAAPPAQPKADEDSAPPAKGPARPAKRPRPR